MKNILKVDNSIISKLNILIKLRINLMLNCLRKILINNKKRHKKYNNKFKKKRRLLTNHKNKNHFQA